jgi:hypothetical protein
MPNEFCKEDLLFQVLPLLAIANNPKEELSKAVKALSIPLVTTSRLTSQIRKASFQVLAQKTSRRGQWRFRA